jgi:hypothetical protein
VFRSKYHLIIAKNIKRNQEPVAQVHNPSTLGGLDQKDMIWGQSLQEVSETPFQPIIGYGGPSSQAKQEVEIGRIEIPGPPF